MSISSLGDTGDVGRMGTWFGDKSAWCSSVTLSRCDSLRDQKWGSVC